MLSGLVALLIVGSLAGSVEAESDRGCHRTPCYPRYDRGYYGECGGYGACGDNRGYGGYRGYGDYGGYGNYGGYRDYNGYRDYRDYDGSGW